MSSLAAAHSQRDLALGDADRLSITLCRLGLCVRRYCMSLALILHELTPENTKITEKTNR